MRILTLLVLLTAASAQAQTPTAPDVTAATDTTAADTVSIRISAYSTWREAPSYNGAEAARHPEGVYIADGFDGNYWRVRSGTQRYYVSNAYVTLRTPRSRAYASTNARRFPASTYGTSAPPIRTRSEAAASSRSTTPRASAPARPSTGTRRAPNCKKGKPCGGSCIARNKTCRVG